MRRTPFAIILLLILSMSNPVFADQVGTNPSGQTGKHGVLVVPVEFSDIKHNMTIAQIEQKIANVSQYITNTSSGLTWLDITVVPQWQLLRGTFKDFSYPNNLMDTPRIISEVLKQINSEYNVSRYQHLVIIHAGFSFEAMRSRSLAPIYYSDPKAVVNNPIIVSENDTIGMMMHEMLHGIGGYFEGALYGRPILRVQDLYDENLAELGRGDNIYVGQWDIMSSSTNGPSSWTKLKLGWLPEKSLVTVNNRSATVSLSPLEGSQNGALVVKIPLGVKKTQYPNGTSVNAEIYYLLEYRKKIGIDAGIDSQGILILKADDSRYFTSQSGPLLYIAGPLQFLPKQNDYFTDKTSNLTVMVLPQNNTIASVQISTYSESAVITKASGALYSAIQISDLQKNSSKDPFEISPRLSDIQKELDSAIALFQSAKFQLAENVTERTQTLINERNENRIEIYSALEAIAVIVTTVVSILAIRKLVKRDEAPNSQRLFVLTSYQILCLSICVFVLLYAVWTIYSGLIEVVNGIDLYSNIQLETGKSNLVFGPAIWGTALTLTCLILQKSIYYFPLENDEEEKQQSDE